MVITEILAMHMEGNGIIGKLMQYDINTRFGIVLTVL